MPACSINEYKSMGYVKYDKAELNLLKSMEFFSQPLIGIFIMLNSSIFLKMNRLKKTWLPLTAGFCLLCLSPAVGCLSYTKNGLNSYCINLFLWLYYYISNYPKISPNLNY